MRRRGRLSDTGASVTIKASLAPGSQRYRLKFRLGGMGLPRWARTRVGSLMRGNVLWSGSAGRVQSSSRAVLELTKDEEIEIGYPSPRRRAACRRVPGRERQHPLSNN